MPAVIGDHRDGLAVVARQHAFHRSVAGRVEGDPVADPEFQHLGMRPHLGEEAQPGDDAVIEVDKFRFAQRGRCRSASGALLRPFQ